MDCVVLSALLLHLASGASEHHARVAGLLVLVESSVCGAERRERSREAKVGSHGFSQGGDSRLRREGLFDFLRPRPEVHVYQVDFQQHPAHERRRARGALRRSRRRIRVASFRRQVMRGQRPGAQSRALRVPFCSERLVWPFDQMAIAGGSAAQRRSASQASSFVLRRCHIRIGLMGASSGHRSQSL